jgi:hypothetical protein
MHKVTTGPMLMLFGALVALANAVPMRVAEAANYCPNPAHARPAKVPSDLVPALAATFHVAADAVRNAAFVRCVGKKLLGCSVGANLDCFKADQRRTLPGATAWCRDHPGATDIPMAATGHATIYAWSCNGRRAVAGKAVVKVDPQGYIAENWNEIQ